MSRSRSRHRHGGEHENDERWLLTYADMITLLMALFMVLFSISSVNISKYLTLQQALHAAFSGSILPGGHAVMQAGTQSTSHHSPTTADVPSIVPLTPKITAPNSQQARLNAASVQEQDNFLQIQRLLQAYAQSHGFANQVQTIITANGLIIRVLTDNLLFDTDQADLKPAGLPLLGEISNLLDIDRVHPIVVTGYTDNVPVTGGPYPSNWELSTARAGSVVRFLIAHGVSAGRLEAAGYAELHPIASNGFAAGRARNRRVEILLRRRYPPPAA